MSTTESVEVVYFIRCTATGRVKIGTTSRSVEERVRELQTGSGAPLMLEFTFRGGVALEQRWHDAFAHHRLHGEWFNIPTETIEQLRKLADAAEQERLAWGQYERVVADAGEFLRLHTWEALDALSRSDCGCEYEPADGETIRRRWCPSCAARSHRLMLHEAEHRGVTTSDKRRELEQAIKALRPAPSLGKSDDEGDGGSS